ncbi:hypothetical protein CBR_g37415 [Chara braunii]|uniref:Uncharacterized protein n=1 Tax=Chara braunii TaxID=69332 RepID=A0A388LMV7_CHABU|nr:hypothetical protein CBR_g37415 [Chara braunii]|eukprot:GBG83611.1 hypothetical protein CBR_g37415 [Chara braunii]
MPFVEGSKKTRQTPAAAGGRKKQLPSGPTPPAPGASGANLPLLPSPSPSPSVASPSVRGGRDLAQASSKATEYDDGLRQRNAGRENSQDCAIALDDNNDEDEEGGSGGPHDDGGNQTDMEVGDDNMQDRDTLVDVEVAAGQPSTSRGISRSPSTSKGGHNSQAMQGPKAKKRTRETSPSASTHKRQARTDVVDEARGALTASQEARPSRKNSHGGRSGGHGGGCGGGAHGGARKGSQRVRPQEMRDSGDDGEGVDPRMPEDVDKPAQHTAIIDTTRCFFL